VSENPVVDSAGDKRWFSNGCLHKDGGPAVEWYSGYKAWFKKGKIHREDGPAIEYTNGDKKWFIDGEQLTEEEFNNRNLREFMMDHDSDYTPVMCSVCGQIYNGQMAEDKPYSERTTCGNEECISKVKGEIE